MLKLCAQPPQLVCLSAVCRNVPVLLAPLWSHPLSVPCVASSLASLFYASANADRVQSPLTTPTPVVSLTSLKPRVWPPCPCLMPLSCPSSPSFFPLLLPPCSQDEAFMDTIDPEVRADIECAGRLLARAISRRQRTELQVGLSG